MTAKQWMPIGVLTLLLVAGAAIWASRSGEAPEVTEMKQLANQIMDTDANASDEERQKTGERMRELRENMTQEQRREVGNVFRERMFQRTREFAALPEEERNAFLDEDIDRMEQMRQRFRDRGDRGGRGGGPGAEGGRGGQRGGGEGRGGEGRGGRGDRANMTEEERDSRRRQRTDSISPEDKAYMGEYFKAIAARREERGMEPMQWGRPGRPRK